MIELTRKFNMKCAVRFSNLKAFIIRSALPSGCMYYRGPHPVDCVIAIWEDAGCILEGRNHPSRLGDAALSALRSRAIT